MFDLNLDDAINIKKQMKKENLYDPLLDEKDDEWARRSLGILLWNLDWKNDKILINRFNIFLY